MNIAAEMSGTVWKVLVRIGEAVEAGQDLMILESMKMEIPVTAENAGTVVEIRVNEGDFVQESDVLLVLK